LTAVRQDGLSLEFADQMLKNDRAIVIAAVRQNGLALRFAGPMLKKDYEIVMVAVEQCGGVAFEYADPMLKQSRRCILDALQHREPVCDAVKKKSHAYLGAGLDRNHDREFVLAGVEQDGSALQYATPRLQEDLKVDNAAEDKIGALNCEDPEVQRQSFFGRKVHGAFNGSKEEFDEAVRAISKLRTPSCRDAKPQIVRNLVRRNALKTSEIPDLTNTRSLTSILCTFLKNTYEDLQFFEELHHSTGLGKKSSHHSLI